MKIMTKEEVKCVGLIEYSRKQLLEDYIEYVGFSEEEAKEVRRYKWSDVHFRPLPSLEPSEMWDFYVNDEGALQNNVEFVLQRSPDYEQMIFKYLGDMKNVFVHGSGVGYIVLILMMLGKDVDYYEPNEKCKEFHEWRCKKHYEHFNFTCHNEQDRTDKCLHYNVYDFIISLDVLEHLDAPLRTLSKLSRMLTLDGLLLQMPCYWLEHEQHLVKNRWLTHEYIIKTMDSLGFDLVEARNKFYVHKPRYNYHPVWKL